MKASEITFEEFLQLPESERMLIQEAFICQSETYDIDCLQWEWGQVKKAQELIAGDITYYDILETVQIEGSRFSARSKAANVFQMFTVISEHIKKISQMEDTTLSSDLTPKERLAIEVVGGFSEFGTLPQTLLLCKLFNDTFVNIQKYKYHICFLALYYDKKQGDFNKELLTTHHHD
jgi:hypothetical protein